MHLAHTKVYKGRRYILANYGVKPTGGFGIAIEDVEIDDEQITVIISYSDPGPDENVTQALTYPQDIVYTDNLDLPIEYVAAGDKEYVPILRGIVELPKIVAESDFIKVFTPAPNENVPQTITVEGVANVFEGSISYLLRDADGTATGEQFTTAGMGDWYFFTFDIQVPEMFSDNLSLELFSYSAKDGSIIHLVEIPLQRK